MVEPIPEIREDGENKKLIQELIGIFSQKKISLLYLSPEEACLSLNGMPGEFSFFLTHFYSRNYRKEWEDFRKKIFPNPKPESSLNQNTIQEFSLRWTANHCKNAKDLQLLPILQPDPRHKSQPFLFLGAAPNLEDQLPLVRKMEKDSFLLSSDTALSYLLAHGIQPSAVLSLDPGRGTHYHIPESIPESIPIITWLGGCREWFFRKNPLYLYLSSYPLDQFIQQFHSLGDDCILENPSLNIAGMGLALARYWGFQSIYLGGVDFTSQSGKTHCRGTGYESYALPLTNRRQTLERLYPFRVYSRHLSNKNKWAKERLLQPSSPQEAIHPIEDIEINPNPTPENHNSFPKETTFQPPHVFLAKPGKKDWQILQNQNLPGVDRKIFRKHWGFSAFS